MYTTAIVTISDKGSEGKREDLSGSELKKILSEAGYRISAYTIIPDDLTIIVNTLVRLADVEKTDMVVTTGGTGLSPRDVTPEATAMVIEKEVPGMAEAMRAVSLQKTPHAMLSRALVGIRKETLIINLPGSPKGVRENLTTLLPALPHALAKIKGDPSECAR
ncbi:MAG: MogA/MoaB family molybdenum cofactor biosynthesis protein [Thermodesulfobacteriota bacterium]